MVALLHNIVIAGGGIVGNSIAYFLAKRNIPVTLVDPVGVAPGASSKAGGFLAKEWRDDTLLEEIQRKGFDLHQEIANELGPEKVDYRRLTCMAVAIDETKLVVKPTSRKARALEWADKGVIGSQSMGNRENIAQVHPLKLCQEMWTFSEQQGSDLIVGKVVKAVLDDESSTIQRVELEDGTVLPADTLIVACGPWTSVVKSWFPASISERIPLVTGVKCHSILVKSPKPLSEAVFFESEGPLSTLEVYPRPDGDAYCNGFEGKEGIVQELPGQEVVEDEAIESLQNAIGRTTSLLEDVEAHTKQACYWPETPDGRPLIGTIPNVSGAYLAAGHSVWGILQGPITGKAVAELVVDGVAKSLDLTNFRLDRKIVTDKWDDYYWVST
jgi:glycine/D-amino acid oxidase-like deaminating enzyme